jgi:hypothetical protein
MSMITLEQLDKRFESLGAKLDVRFDLIHRRFEIIDRKFERMDQRFDALDTKIDDKIDELAAITAHGFTELRTELKSDVHRIEHRLEVIEEHHATKDDLMALADTFDAALLNSR